MNEGKPDKPAGARRARRFRKRARVQFRRLCAAWRKIYGPWERASARLLDRIAASDRRRRIASVVIALSINLVVLTLLSTFARVRIWIPNAPSSTINVTLVEVLRPELPLRDPELFAEPEPEPDPEIVETLEPEPEPEPEPVRDPEPVAEPEPEPAEDLEPEPELDIRLDLEPQFAPPAEAFAPLIPDPAPAAQDDLSLPEPEDPVEQTPAADDPEPLISVTPQARQETGLEEILGDEESDGEDAAAASDEVDEEEEEDEDLIADQPPQNDDIFDQEPVFSGRRFILPKVQLPQGELPATPGSSGVVAIFCPEEFADDDKAKECAGRPDIRSGWRPGDSGEDWSRATELLQRARERGRTGPDLDKIVGPAAARRIEADRRVRDLADPRRSADDVNNLADAADDNLSSGVEGNRPDIGPQPFEPNWTLPEDGALTQEEIEELRKALEEAEAER